MLKKFRARHIKTTLWILLIIIVPSFVFWGISSFIRNRKANAVVIVGDKSLSYSELKKYLIMANIFYQLTLGEDFYRNTNRQALIENKAFEYILLLKKAKEDNIKATDKEVVDLIKNIFSYKGEFDNEYYKRYVQGKWMMTPKAFEEYIRNIITADKVLDKYARNVKISDKEIKELYKKNNEKIKLSYIYIPYKNIKETINVSDDEIKNYYASHKDEFTTKPKIKVKYLVFDRNKNQKIIDKMIRHVKNITKIDYITEKLSLDAKVTEYFDKEHPPQNTIWNKKALELAFSLPLNTLSPLIEVGDKYIIFEKIEEKKGYIIPLENLKKKLKKKLKKEKAKKKAEKLATKVLKDVLANKEKKFAELAQEYKLTTNTTDYFNRTMPPSNLYIDNSILYDLFTLKKGEVYNKIVEGKKGAYIVKLNSYLPIDENNLNKEKEEYRQRIRAQKIFIKTINFLSQLEKETPIKRIVK